MEEECSDVRSLADEAGDKHFGAMTDYVTKGRRPDHRERAYFFGKVYRRALDWLIRCYQSVHSRIAERKLRRALELRKIVEHDLDALERGRPAAETK